MRLGLLIACAIVVLILAGVCKVFFTIVRHGVSARDEPTVVEMALARRMRHLAIPAGERAREDPLPASPEVIAEGRAHFADHCALCHANDGSGDTAMGRGLYPKAPDMRLAATQDLSDGELFWIIRNGIRLTGMPAWGSDSPEDSRDSWALVRFIRRLPALTPEEIAVMKTLNPKSPSEMREENEIDRFLEGGAEVPQHSH